MRRLPMLEDLRVASPCSESWDEMVGDDRVRFCTSCEKNVYNLSAMLMNEAEQLLAERTGGDLCVRFYQRADGTVMTQDCPVGVKKKQRKKLALAVAGAGALAAAALFHHREQTHQLGATGTIIPTGSGAALEAAADPHVVMGAPPPMPMIQGSAVIPPPAPPPQTPVTMGRRSAASLGHVSKKNL